jgi:pimeloyl-ACP methyl ester carboxylesterase
MVAKKKQLKFIEDKPINIIQHLPEKCGIIMGTVYNETPAEHPIAIAVFTHDPKRKEFVDYTILFGSGGYMLYIPEGNYSLHAFPIRNMDLTANQEYLLNTFAYDNITLTAGSVLGGVDIDVSKPVDLQLAHHQPHRKVGQLIGQILPLEDEVFAPKYGTMGWWSPSEFMEEIGSTITFLEPYDPNKIPVLYVHGAAGTPRTWDLLCQSLDRDNFQPWFFYYPSGLRIPTNVRLLDEKITALHKEHKFDTLYIVAHSLGGLVVRSFLNEHELDTDYSYLKLFITLASPLGGDPRAGKGLKHISDTDRLLANWLDIAEGSSFINTLYENELPSDLKYYLIFAFKGDSSTLSGCNDGMVTLKSQLHPPAQDQAQAIFGFHETHIGVLVNPDVICKINTLLQQTTQSLSHSAATP